MSTEPLLGDGGLAFVFAYLGSLLLIGWYANRRSVAATASDYYLAGSSLGAVSLFFTLYATQYSGNTLIALPGKAYRNGLEGLAIMFAVMGIVLVYSLFAPRLNRLAREQGFITVGDFLVWRYHSRALLVVVNLVLVLTLVSYGLGNFKAVGLLLESASGGAVSFPVAVLSLALIMGIYESLGGMRGVVWTDVLQGILLLGGCLAIFLAVSAASPADSITRPAGLGRELREFFTAAVHWPGFLSLVVVVAFGAAVYPQAIQRIYAARSGRTLRSSYRLMFFMPLVTTLPMILVGMSVAEWRPGLAEAESEQVVIFAIQRLAEATPLLSGLLVLCLAAALAAIMSTIDSALLSLGSIITGDWLGERRSRHAGRVTSWVLMLLLALLAIYLPQTVWGLMVFKFELLVQVAPAIILGVRAPRLSGGAVLAGIVAGSTLVIANQLWPGQPLGAYAGLTGAGLNLLTLVAATLVQGRPGGSPTSATAPPTPPGVKE